MVITAGVRSGSGVRIDVLFCLLIQDFQRHLLELLIRAVSSSSLFVLQGSKPAPKANQSESTSDNLNEQLGVRVLDV